MHLPLSQDVIKPIAFSHVSQEHPLLPVYHSALAHPAHQASHPSIDFAIICVDSQLCHMALPVSCHIVSCHIVSFPHVQQYAHITPPTAVNIQCIACL